MSAINVVTQLGAVSPFDVLTPDALEELAPSLRQVQLATGEDLVTTGDEAEELFVVLAGSLEIIAPAGPGGGTIVLGTLSAGEIVGEIAVLTGGTRSATLRAVAPVEVIGIPAAPFAALLEREPALGRQLASIASARLRATRLTGQLQRLFPGTDALPLPALVDRVEFIPLGAGTVLFEEGEASDAAYVVVSGRVRILVRQDDRWASPISEVGAGELIGEMALLDDVPRAATVVAARDSVVARLPREDFESLATSHPLAMLAVTRTIVSRSRDRRERFRRATSDHAAIGLVPVTPGVDLAGLATALTERLQRNERVQLITTSTLEHALRVPGIAQARAGEPNELRLARWMDEAEATNDLLVLQGEPVVSPWTRRCIDRVDHLVLVADATEHPHVSELERLLVSARDLPHQRVSLVLLHPATTDRPRGTADWLDARDVDEHHHVRLGRDGDLDRLARHLAGRAVTLVFSGGGAKGFAHLGVVRAMRELAIPIDAVAGASMGAPLAAAVAMDIPDDELVPMIARLYHKVLDYTVPVSSMISGRRIAHSIEEGIGDRDIEDTWLPYFCVSTNLTRSRLEVHRTGAMALAVRASLSIPGVMPPVPYRDEDLLVDGGVLNNLPVDIARGLNPTGTVVASDVAPLLGPRKKSDYGMYVSGTRVLAKRLTPGMKAPRVPAIMATLMRSMLVAAAEQRDRGIAEKLADLHLQLDLRGVGLLDFEVCAPVAEQGYQEALGQLSEWVSADVPRMTLRHPANT
jgi:predicted acylesterase/phospholipase RssA/CRP-like cAMP-binding protein